MKIKLVVTEFETAVVLLSFFGKGIFATNSTAKSTIME